MHQGSLCSKSNILHQFGDLNQQEEHHWHNLRPIGRALKSLPIMVMSFCTRI